MILRRGLSRPPSPYNRYLFHGIRAVQAVSATIVTGLLSYFVAWLRYDLFVVPWSFILLLAISSFTLFSILSSSFFYAQRTLTPTHSLGVNAILSALWTACFASLSWWLSGTLMNDCSVDNWEHQNGVTVCVQFKTLEFFTLLGTLSTIASLILDIWTRRRSTSLGKYNQMGSPNVSKSNISYPYARDGPRFRDSSDFRAPRYGSGMHDNVSTSYGHHDPQEEGFEMQGYSHANGKSNGRQENGAAELDDGADGDIGDVDVGDYDAAVRKGENGNLLYKR